MSILFFSNDSSAGQVLSGLRSALPEIPIINFAGSSQEDRTAARYAVVWNPPDNFFDHTTGLKTIFSLAAGVDHLLNHPSLPRDIPLARLENAGMSDKMAEYVLYGVLHYQRAMNHYRQAQQNGHWDKTPRDRHAGDVHVGLLGIGAMGSVVAGRLLQNGYRVSGWSRRDKHIANVESFSGNDTLDIFIEQVDVLVCLLPLTKETTGIIDARRLQKLGTEGYLINAARGRHVDTAALVDALQQGVIQGALLDVTEPEPLPADHPLWSLSNVLITPHVAAPTQTQASIEQIAANIRRAENGEALTGKVTDAGY